MGSRGPLRSPHSVRGERERRQQRKQQRQTAPAKVLRMPSWLPETARETWRRVLMGLREAQVPLERIDAETVGFYVLCIDGAEEAAKRGDPKMLARFSRDAITWANQIGATPAARARMGIKPEVAYDANNPWAKLRAETDELKEILNRPRQQRGDG